MNLVALRTSGIYLLLATLLYACSSADPDSPEQRLEQVLNDIEAAVEARSMSQALMHVSEDYLDHQNKSKADIARLLQMHYIRNQSISLFSSVNSLEIDQQLASVELSVAMAGNGTVANALDLRADSVQFSAVFQDSDESWKLISASWR